MTLRRQRTLGKERPLGIPNIEDRVVQMAAKLVLEPIFEADLEPDSYGFRPQRSAHQALEAIRESLSDGMVWVLDADVSSYFDTIPHDKLMKVIAKRVVDSSMLALVKMFLAAPVIDERVGGGPRRAKAGVPQGGVVSPLLANVYLHLLDRSFRRSVERGSLEGRLVRYCDDFVLLCRHQPEQKMHWLRALMGRLELELHPDKTRLVDTRKEGFDFLGYRVSRRGRAVKLDISLHSRRRIHARLRQPTRLLFLGIEEVVERLNPYIRGAREYYKLAPWWSLRCLDGVTKMRLARWWGKKLKLGHPAWSRVSGQQLQTRHGVLSWAGRPSWDQRIVCACG